MATNQCEEKAWALMLSPSFPGVSYSDEEESVLTYMVEEEEDFEDTEPAPREDPAPTIITVKDQETELGELRKENFGLKLRIYHLEETVIKKFGTRDGWRTNVELNVQVKKLEEELSEKNRLLVTAKVAIDQYERQKLQGKLTLMEKERQKMEESSKVVDLTQRCHAQAQELDSFKSLLNNMVVSLRKKDMELKDMAGQKDYEHERVCMLESLNSQKDDKIQFLSTRIHKAEQNKNKYVKTLDHLIAEMETLQKEIKKYRNGTECTESRPYTGTEIMKPNTIPVREVSNNSYRRKLAARPPKYLSSVVVNVEVEGCDLVGPQSCSSPHCYPSHDE